jgi:hypothetical protein
MPDIMKMGKNPNYLGSWDLEDHPNREITLTIDKIVDEEVANDGRKEVCTVVRWTDPAYKPMILNVTNKKTLCKLYKTKDTEKLRGKSIVIGTERVKAFGDVHDALRIRPRVPAVKAASAPLCEKCKKPIASHGSMSAEQIAAYTKTKYGSALCEECAKAAKEA